MMNMEEEEPVRKKENLVIEVQTLKKDKINLKKKQFFSFLIH